MAGCQDCERYQYERGNQAASPPTILSQCLLLKSMEARFEPLLRGLSLVSSAG
jgi:hypothetical protein